MSGITLTGGKCIRGSGHTATGAGGTVTNTGANATLTLSHAQDVGTNRTFSGNITGNLNFVLNSITGVTGTQTLANTSSYTGFTTISSGTLVLGIDNALPTTTTLNVNGGGAIASAVDLGGFSHQIDTLSGTVTTGALGVGTILNNAVKYNQSQHP